MTVWTINGRTQDDSFVFRSGLRMQVTPEGDCRECTFLAKGAGIGLRPLDTVQIAVDGVPLFYGEIRVGGNPADVDGHQFTVRSLALRLREVTIPENWTAPQQNAGTTVRSLIQAVLPAMGNTITIGEISLPFDCRAVKDARQQNPYALLEQIAADGEGMGVKVRFGVNARREFFCVPARENEQALDGYQTTGATKWTAPVAEAPCTAVLWYIAKKPDGSWMTHKSLASEAAVYGERVKPVTLTSDEGLWRLAASGTWELVRHATTGDTSAQRTALTAAEVAVLTDGKTDTAYSTSYAGFSSVQHTPGQWVDRYFVSASASDVNGNKQPVYAGEVTYPNAWAQGMGGVSGGVLPAWSISGIMPVAGHPAVVTLAGLANKQDGTPYGTTLTVTAFRPEVLRRDLLDKIAKRYYNIPATMPADIEVRGIITKRTGRVTWRGWQSPVECYEYRITAERGLCTGILAGQADDPAKLAQADLIKARDGRAVITAITAGG